MSQQRPPKWMGSLRITPYIIGFILLASISTLGLAITSAVQVYKASIDASLWSYTLDHRWSVGWHIAYFTTAPLISTVHSCLDLILFVFSPTAAGLCPTYAVIGAAIMAIGWVMQLVFWFQCDFLLVAADYAQCQQFYLVQDDHATASMAGKIAGVDGDVTAAKVVLGCIISILYLAYFFVAGLAVYRQRAGRRRIEEEMDERLGSAHVKRNTSKNATAAIFYA